MKIEYITGDLIASDELVIVHGCNAKGTFSSGIAGTIREHLPYAYAAYRSAFDDLDPKSHFSLGGVIWGFDIGHVKSRIVGNMITQADYGRDPNKVYVDYDAVEMAFRALNDFVGNTQDGTIVLDGLGPITRVGMPLIGCGLGNGSWSTISRIIERESKCFEPFVYTLDGIIPEN